MRRDRPALAALLLLALCLSLLPAGPAAAARRRGGLFNSRQAALYTRACLDGLAFTIADFAPPERDELTIVGSLMRADAFGSNLSTTIRMGPLAAPVPVDGSGAAPYTVGGRGLFVPAPGQPWQVGDRVGFTLTSADGIISGTRQGATVQRCSVGDPEPEVHDYLPADDGTASAVTVADEEFVVGAARVALFLRYTPPAATPLTISLHGPGGRAATLLSLPSTAGLSLGDNFLARQAEGGAYAMVFDAASGFTWEQAAALTLPHTVAVRPADPGLGAMLGAPSAGQWRLEVRGAGGALINTAPGDLLELRWKLELTRAEQVHLPLVTRGGAPQPAPVDLAIYTDALAGGWESAGWSYGANVDLAATERALSAPNAIAVTYTEPFGGLTFRSAEPIAVAGAYRAISLAIWGAPGGSSLGIYAQAADDGDLTEVHTFSVPGGTWTTVEVPLSALGSPPVIKRFSLQEERGEAGATIYVDDVRLVR